MDFKSLGGEVGFDVLSLEGSPKWDKGFARHFLMTKPSGGAYQAKFFSDAQRATPPWRGLVQAHPLFEGDCDLSAPGAAIWRHKKWKNDIIKIMIVVP